MNFTTLIACVSLSLATKHTLQIHGEGNASQTADGVVVSVGIETVQLTVTKAKVMVQKTVASLMAIRDGFNISSSDFVMADMNLQRATEYEDGKYVNKGLRFSQSVSIRIRNLANLADVLESILSIPTADLISLDHVIPFVDDVSRMEDEAYIRATNDAIKRGSLVARQAKMYLGRPRLIEVKQVQHGHSPMIQKATREHSQPSLTEMYTHSQDLAVSVKKQVYIEFDLNAPTDGDANSFAYYPDGLNYVPVYQDIFYAKDHV